MKGLFDKKVLIVGAGGFGKEVLTYLENCIGNTSLRIEDVAMFLDSPLFKKGVRTVHNVPVISRAQFDPLKFKVLIAVANPLVRKTIVSELPKETEYATLIHPSAFVSKHVKIGEGSIITPGSILTTDIEIGKHAHINLHTTIGHDCTIGDFFTTAPATNISGSCEIGDCVYFGTNTSIKQGKKVCDNVTIGMGAVVVKDIDSPGIFIGNPARRLDKQLVMHKEKEIA